MLMNAKLGSWGKILPFAAVACMPAMLLSAGGGDSIGVEIDPGKKFQKIEYFGASDAWSTQYVGDYWEDLLKEKAARLLFSRKFDGAGNPEGIGLSLWRVNLGGGSLEGDESPIKFPWRGARSFIDPESGKIDMARCPGLRYFMEKAKEHGCENFLLFSNTPPIGMTKNSSYHKTEPDFRSNLKEDCYDDFAEYLAEVAKRLSDSGYNIKYISPVNEPSWKWTTDAQEGTPWLNPEIKRLAVELDKSIQKRGLETKIFLPEADSIQNIYGCERFQKDNPNSREDAAFNQLYAFFDPASKDYIGGLKTLARQIGAHSYHTHLKNGQLREVRERAAKEAQKYGVEFHQTEWCFLGFYADPKKLDGFTADWKTKNYADMQTALHMAKIIYADFVFGGARSWSYWVATELRDGICALIDAEGFVEDAKKGREMRPNKLLWALGNYSFFIRPGYDRVSLEGAEDLDGVIASAYASPDGGKIVAVFVNFKHGEVAAKVSLKSSGAKLSGVYKTDDRSDLALVKFSPESGCVELAPRSVTTAVWTVRE